LAKKKIHIDELFRRELGDMKMPVDTNDWAAMQAQIAAEQNKRKRRALWWWFAGIALLLMGSLTTYYFLSLENSKQNDIVVENATPSPSIKQPKANNTPLSIDRETENTASNQSTNSIDITPDNAKTNSSDKPVSSAKQSSSKTETKKSTSSADRDIKRELERLKNKKNSTGNDKKNIDKGTNNGSSGKGTTEPKEDKNTSTDKIPNPITIVKPVDSNKVKKAPQNKIVVAPDSAKTSNDSSKKVKDGSKPKLLPFSIGFSLGAASNSFTADENSNFGRILNNGNQPALGFNALFTANYAIKNFEINSGLGINSITNSGSYNYTHQTKDSIPVLDPLNNIIGYFYTNFRDTTHNFNIQSRFTSITLPIGVSYNIKLNDNSGLQLGANTSINYLVGASGEYINPFNLFQLNVGDNKDLFRKWNLGLGASIGYYSKISEQFTFEGSINYNTLTNGIFDNRIGTAIRPSSIGINVGIRYNFKLRK
jgi:hypothetical protein